MARYIDANKLSRDVISSWDRDTHKTIEASRIHRQEHHHLMSIIEKQPTADVMEAKRGEWIQLDECANEGVYCSVCHKKVYKIEYANQALKSAYCPNCGADMRGDK